MADVKFQDGLESVGGSVSGTTAVKPQDDVKQGNGNANLSTTIEPQDDGEQVDDDASGTTTGETQHEEEQVDESASSTTTDGTHPEATQVRNEPEVIVVDDSDDDDEDEEVQTVRVVIAVESDDEIYEVIDVDQVEERRNEVVSVEDEEGAGGETDTSQDEDGANGKSDTEADISTDVKADSKADVEPDVKRDVKPNVKADTKHTLTKTEIDQVLTTDPPPSSTVSPETSLQSTAHPSLLSRLSHQSGDPTPPTTPQPSSSRELVIGERSATATPSTFSPPSQSSMAMATRDPYQPPSVASRGSQLTPESSWSALRSSIDNSVHGQPCRYSSPIWVVPADESSAHAIPSLASTGYPYTDPSQTASSHGGSSESYTNSSPSFSSTSPTSSSTTFWDVSPWNATPPSTNSNTNSYLDRLHSYYTSTIDTIRSCITRNQNPQAAPRRTRGRGRGRSRARIAQQNRSRAIQGAASATGANSVAVVPRAQSRGSGKKRCKQIEWKDSEATPRTAPKSLVKKGPQPSAQPGPRPSAPTPALTVTALHTGTPRTLAIKAEPAQDSSIKREQVVKRELAVTAKREPEQIKIKPDPDRVQPRIKPDPDSASFMSDILASTGVKRKALEGVADGGKRVRE